MFLNEEEVFEEGIYQLETTDPVQGGPNGIDNLQAKQLANRTQWLKAAILAITGASFIAAKALKLANARTIGGVSFDGSNNINLPGVNTIGNQDTSGNAATATKLKVARSINGVDFDGTQDITITIESVLPGTVVNFAKNTAPSGYLKANGAAVSRTTYAELFAAIGTTFGSGDGSTTFNLPDLRGEFIRGWDDSRGVDSGRVFGSSQEDSLQGFDVYGASVFGHTTAATVGARPYINRGGGVTAQNANWDATGSSPDSRTVVALPIGADDVNGTPRLGSETRPRNTALLACIKY